MKLRTTKLCLVCAAALAWPGLLLSQTCTITSPTAGQVYGPPVAGPSGSIPSVQFNATVSSAPTWHRIAWFVRGKYWASGYRTDPRLPIGDFRDGYQGAGTVSYQPALTTDGAVPLTAQVQDIFGTILATCSTTFVSRYMGMSNSSFTFAPTSGTSATFSASAFGAGLTNGLNTSLWVDGRNDGTTGCFGNLGSGPTWTGVNTTCFLNGPHEFYAVDGEAFGMAGADPQLETATFTCSGNNIQITGHALANNAVVVLSNSGGSLCAPLVAGSAWFNNTSTSNPSNTASVSVTNPTVTITLSASSGLTGTFPIFVRNINSTNQTTGLSNCDGYYPNASISGASITFTSAGCPTGAAASGSLEVWINPYFVNYVNGNAVTVSATPGGSVVALTSAGSGTNTLTQRMRFPYWTDSGFGNGGNDDGVAVGVNVSYAFAISTVTLNNGTAPMEQRPKDWDYVGVAGVTSNNVCPTIANTDGTFTIISCTLPTYAVVPDGGLTGVCSVTNSGVVTYLMPGWCQVTVACTACAAGGVSLPTVTTYHHAWPGSVSAPQFSHSAGVLTAFSPGSSFFPLTMRRLGISYGTGWAATNAPQQYTPWLGTMMNQANLNSGEINPPGSGANQLSSPLGTVCPTWATANGSQFTYEQSFASTYGIYISNDWGSTMWNPDVRALSLVLGNIGYNRPNCVQSFASTLAGYNNWWRSTLYDEFSDELGTILMPNAAIGGSNWTNATTAAGSITFHTANIPNLQAWLQPAGSGTAIQISGATTNPCMNTWFLPTSVSPTTIVAPTSCANGLTITSSTDPGAKMNMPISPVSSQWNLSYIPGDIANQNVCETWSGSSLSGCGNAGPSSIVCASGTCTFNWTSHAIANGQAIRVKTSSSTNLNTVAATTFINANSFSITYSGAAGMAAPANGTYNSTTDPGLSIQVDPNWTANPIATFRNLVVSAATPHAAWCFTMLGSLFTVANAAGLTSWEGSPNSDCAYDYIAQGPGAIYGEGPSVWAMMNYSNPWSGLATRAYQNFPRVILMSVGPSYTRFCASFQFNPSCDRPWQITWIPEASITSQIFGMLALNVNAIDTYNFTDNTPQQYLGPLGWQKGGYPEGGTQINPYIDRDSWTAMALAYSAIKRNEKYYLEPQCNSPYYGPYFTSTCRISSYGGYLQITSGSATPYQQTIDLTPIRQSGGTLRRESITAHRMTITPLTGNPTSDTYNFGAADAGETVIYVSQPSGATSDLDNIAFAPPASLPFGATKFLIQVSYYPNAMEDNPVTDCTTGCTIAIDHHNVAAWYRVIYADANTQPLSTGEPSQILSQGLY